MRSVRSLLTQTPATVLSIAAVVLSLGGGAYASTQATRSHQSPGSRAAASQTASGTSALVSWSTLKLKNGWVSSNSIYSTGSPKVALRDGVAYLSGSMHQPTPGSSVFASLPKADRPTHNLYITTYTNGDTTGTLYIGADGTMEAYSAGSCGSGSTAQCFTSLATVSFPVNS